MTLAIDHSFSAGCQGNEGIDQVTTADIRKVVRVS